MIVLDENIDEPQRRRLEMWRIRVRQIGVEVGQLGMKDLNEIIPLLHGVRLLNLGRLRRRLTWGRLFPPGADSLFEIAEPCGPVSLRLLEVGFEVLLRQFTAFGKPLVGFRPAFFDLLETIVKHTRLIGQSAGHRQADAYE